jgi:hypothetical protein
LTKLAAKGYSIEQRHHSATAVRLLVRPDPKDPSLYLQLSNSSLSGPQVGTLSPLPSAGTTTSCPSAVAPLLPVSGPAMGRTSWEREFRDLESAIKLRNYSTRTLEAYRFWVTRFQAFVRSRPTAKLSNQEVRGFLSSLIYLAVVFPRRQAHVLTRAQTNAPLSCSRIPRPGCRTRLGSVTTIDTRVFWPSTAQYRVDSSFNIPARFTTL